MSVSPRPGAKAPNSTIFQEHALQHEKYRTAKPTLNSTNSLLNYRGDAVDPDKSSLSCRAFFLVDDSTVCIFHPFRKGPVEHISAWPSPARRGRF